MLRQAGEKDQAVQLSLGTSRKQSLLGHMPVESAMKRVQTQSPSEHRTQPSGTSACLPAAKARARANCPGVQEDASRVCVLMPSGLSVAAQMSLLTHTHIHTRVGTQRLFSSFP